jgi:maleylacetoacetate isomerase
MQLHSFFNSSASYRVRIALSLKGIEYETVPIDIRAGQQHHPEQRAVNPWAGVPVLVAGELTLSQSLAIIDHLDTDCPGAPLIPHEQPLRAHVLEFALGIACDLHPLNNLRVLNYLVQTLGATEAQKKAWYRHWVDAGLQAADTLLQRHGHGPFCFGAAPTLADCCLVPQVANALRMGCDTSTYHEVMAVYRHAS